MSSLKDLASLIMIPSLYKDGRLDTVKPLGNSIIHPDATGNNDGTDGTTPAEGNFTFSRGSNLAATRVDVNGLIEKGRENLLTYSNTFSDSDWGKGSSLTLTSGQSGYDGTNNAWLLSKGSVQYPSLGQQVSNSGVKTLSVYAKANATSNLCLFVSSSPSNFYQDFDLSNGTLGAGSNGVIATNIDSVGDGWYRCSVVFNGVTTSADIFPDTISGANAGSIYIQDAQLEQSMVATDYIETGASTAQAGILEDMPRLDYSGGASCPALLLEPQRTNSILHSEYIASWAGANTTIVTNAAISPEGVQNASSVTFSAGGYWYKSIAGSYTAGSTHIWSIYANTSTRVVQWGGFTPAGTSVYDIEDVGNGWYRQTLTRTTTGSGSGTFQPLMDSVYVGVGTEFKVYGAQLEYNASYATSYIPTYGSSVTRSLDSCLATSVSDVIGQTQGTMFIDLTIDNLSSQTNNPIPLTLKGSGSTSSYIQVYTSGRVQAVHYGFGSLQANINLPSYGLTDGRHKFAFVYNGNDFRFYIDGALAGSDTSGLVDSQSEIHLGYYNTSFNGTTNNHQAVLFPTALTDSECIALTTL